MPKINFSFSGFIREALVEEVLNNETGEMVSVIKLDAAELAAKLNSGDYSISLGDYLYENSRVFKNEIELFDFEEPI